MPKRYTIRDMQVMASDRNGKCLSKEYLSENKRLVWRCEKGHTWDAYPFVIRRGSWCAKCARDLQKPTLDMVRKTGAKRGFTLLSKQYTDNKTKLEWKCREGHRWMTSYASIKNGFGCHHCSGKVRGSIEKMQMLSKKIDAVCISTRYINNHTPLLWKCNKMGHIWKAVPSNIQQGQGCGHCYGHYRLNIREMQRMAAERGGRCLSKVYVNKETPLIWECAEKHIWKATPGNVRQGSWCMLCAIKKRTIASRGKTIGDMQKLARSRGGKCNSKEYINQYFPLEWECEHGHCWKAVPKNVINGSWCKMCYLQRKNSY